MDAYDEPFDEFMGPSNAATTKMMQAQSQIAPTSQLQHSAAAVISPEPSPAVASIRTSSSSAGPPSSALSNHHGANAGTDRWAYYEAAMYRLASTH